MEAPCIGPYSQGLEVETRLANMQGADKTDTYIDTILNTFFGNNSSPEERSDCCFCSNASSQLQLSAAAAAEGLLMDPMLPP